MTPLPLADLVEDFTLYPRHAVDDANVSSLVNALKAGVTLPPVVVDRASLRVVDGWHRLRAYRRVLGPGAVIDVELVGYPNETEILKDAVRRNASHGRKLDTIDLVRVISMCEERGVDYANVAVLLSVPPERVEKLAVRLATAETESSGTIPGTLSVALKRPVQHMQGQVLSPEQVIAHERAPGTSYLLLASQLSDALRYGLVNAEDERLAAALRVLRQDLEEYFKAA